MKPDIRPCTPTDYEELAALVNSAYRGESSRAGWTTEADYLAGQRTSPANLRRDLCDPATRTVLCMFENGKIIACVYLEKKDEETCYLGMLTVKPDMQDRGLGRVMLEAAEDFARQWGMKRMILGVLCTRDSLMAWYERRGYRRDGVRYPFPYGDPDFGDPLRDDLDFIRFAKNL